MIQQGKGKRVRDMFAAIAPTYDLLNRMLSFKMDRRWRTRAVKELLKSSGSRYLDVATGTADIPLEIMKEKSDTAIIVGVDFTPEMVFMGKNKIEKSGVSGQVKLNCGDCQSLPYQEAMFDGVIAAFGVRNFSDIGQGIREMRRVLRDGGKLIILEFSQPVGPIFKRIYNFYFNTILPFVGGLVSGNKDAYRYLPESVGNFPDMEGLKERIEMEGFKDVHYITLTFGIAAIHVGIK